MIYSIHIYNIIYRYKYYSLTILHLTTSLLLSVNYYSLLSCSSYLWHYCFSMLCVCVEESQGLRAYFWWILGKPDVGSFKLNSLIINLNMAVKWKGIYLLGHKKHPTEHNIEMYEDCIGVLNTWSYLKVVYNYHLHYK